MDFTEPSCFIRVVKRVQVEAQMPSYNYNPAVFLLASIGHGIEREGGGGEGTINMFSAGKGCVKFFRDP